MINLGVFVKFICRDIINGENKANAVLLGLFFKILDFLCPGSIKERIPDLPIIRHAHEDVSKSYTGILFSVFLKVNAIPPAMIRQLTC